MNQEKKKLKKTDKKILLRLLMSSQLGRLNTNNCTQDFRIQNLRRQNHRVTRTTRSSR